MNTKMMVNKFNIKLNYYYKKPTKKTKDVRRSSIKIRKMIN